MNFAVKSFAIPVSAYQTMKLPFFVWEWVLSLKCDNLFGERFCLTAVLAEAGSLGFLIGLSVEAAFSREADTAGANAHTTYGENINFAIRLPVVAVVKVNLFECWLSVSKSM